MSEKTFNLIQEGGDTYIYILKGFLNQTIVYKIKKINS